jgi:hypothetical protein
MHLVLSWWQLIIFSYILTSYVWMFPYFLGWKSGNVKAHWKIDIIFWLSSPLWFSLLIFNRVMELTGN